MFSKSMLLSLALCAATLSGAAYAGQPQSADRGLYKTYEEVATEIPISYGWTTSPVRKIIYSLGPFNFDGRPWIADVRFQVGLTKECAGTVRLGYYVVRGFSPTATDGLYVTRYGLINIPSEQINSSVSLSSLHQMSDGGVLTNVNYNVVLFANSYDTECVGQTLKVKGLDVHNYHGELSLELR